MLQISTMKKNDVLLVFSVSMPETLVKPISFTVRVFLFQYLTEMSQLLMVVVCFLFISVPPSIGVLHACYRILKADSFQVASSSPCPFRIVFFSSLTLPCIDQSQGVSPNSYGILASILLLP